MYSAHLREYQVNVEANSPEQAAEKAVDFMLAPFWHGPTPKHGDQMRIVPIYGGGAETLVMVKP